LRWDTKVLPDGYIPAKLCFVAEGPGKNEVRVGRGLVGATGQHLWHLCEIYGFTRDEVWVSNSSLCAPREVKLSTGAVLSEQVVKNISAQACRRRLIGELIAVTRGVSNYVIMPMGNIALQMLKPERKGARVYQYRGAVMDIDLEQLWIEVNRNRRAA
jgi:uracil-DNA glycosylase